MSLTQDQAPGWHTWAAATAMVSIISLLSLGGLTILPLLSGRSYKIFITLFTGLAVGSLLGSAIFNLIPQAFKLNDHPGYLWKSLVIFSGIYIFYSSEKIMRLYFDRKTKQLQRRNEARQQPQLTESDVANGSGDQNLQISELKPPRTRSKQSQIDNQDTQQNEDNPHNFDPEQENLKQHNHGDDQAHGHNHNHGQDFETLGAFATYKLIWKAIKGEKIDFPHFKLRHGDEIAPLAWMIIIGDSLHNFIDGLSIGANFSVSLWSGFINSVAVICEEFPHELGDFAVLIASGMTLRQAMGFNFLSACTCFLGMIFGILLGDLTSSASYIFALAGGMFLYISLVDMMGELNSMLEEEKNSTRQTFRLLIMQNIGILSGIIITFVLSFVAPGV